MEKELLLLRELYSNPNLTQRDMAKVTGLSLGGINSIIKQFIENGLVKVEKSTKSTMFYHLTSQGLRQKSDSTHRYIVEVYVFIKELNKKLNEILTSIREDYTIVLFGDKDEIYEILKIKLHENEVEFKYVNSRQGVLELAEQYEIFIIVWQQERVNWVRDFSNTYKYLLEII